MYKKEWREKGVKVSSFNLIFQKIMYHSFFLIHFPFKLSAINHIFNCTKKNNTGQSPEDENFKIFFVIESRYGCQ